MTRTNVSISTLINSFTFIDNGPENTFNNRFEQFISTLNCYEGLINIGAFFVLTENTKTIYIKADSVVSVIVTTEETPSKKQKEVLLENG